MSRCNKKCKCNNCEMLQDAILLFVDDSNIMNERRLNLQGYKCIYHGGYALDVKKLKNKAFDDDMIYGNQAVEIINNFTKV